MPGPIFNPVERQSEATSDLLAELTDDMPAVVSPDSPLDRTALPDAALVRRERQVTIYFQPPEVTHNEIRFIREMWLNNVPIINMMRRLQSPRSFNRQPPLIYLDIYSILYTLLLKREIVQRESNPSELTINDFAEFFRLWKKHGTLQTCLAGITERPTAACQKFAGWVFRSIGDRKRREVRQKLMQQAAGIETDLLRASGEIIVPPAGASNDLTSLIGLPAPTENYHNPAAGHVASLLATLSTGNFSRLRPTQVLNHAFNLAVKRDIDERPALVIFLDNLPPGLLKRLIKLPDGLKFEPSLKSGEQMFAAVPDKGVIKAPRGYDLDREEDLAILDPDRKLMAAGLERTELSQTEFAQRERLKYRRPSPDESQSPPAASATESTEELLAEAGEITDDLSLDNLTDDDPLDPA